MKKEQEVNINIFLFCFSNKIYKKEDQTNHCHFLKIKIFEQIYSKIVVLLL